MLSTDYRTTRHRFWELAAKPPGFVSGKLLPATGTGLLHSGRQMSVSPAIGAIPFLLKEWTGFKRAIVSVHA